MDLAHKHVDFLFVKASKFKWQSDVDQGVASRKPSSQRSRAREGDTWDVVPGYMSAAPTHLQGCSTVDQQQHGCTRHLPHTFLSRVDRHVTVDVSQTYAGFPQ